MGNIRKQSLYSSGIIVLGFLIGALNMWLFTSNNHFSADEFGLTRAFFDIAQNFMAVASLGLAPIMFKFYPYYKDNLEDPDNDLLSIVVTGGLIGFILLLALGIYLEPLVMKKFGYRSPLLVDYYYWIFPFTFFYLFFFLLESYSWVLQKTVFPNFLRETGIRMITTVIILLRVFDWISFELFMQLFSISYGGIFIAILVYLIRKKKVYLTFKISRVTRKFYKKMFTLFTLTYLSQIINTLALTFDSILLASMEGLTFTAAYSLAVFAISISMIPQRALIPITIPHLSKAWKDKNMPEISRLYKRSSINLLGGGAFVIINIWLGMEDALGVLVMNPEYYMVLGIMYILGISKMVELGTGVNNHIIGTSIFWRFEFYSGLILLALTLPLNYFLIRAYGMTGAAVSELIRVSVYNLIRLWFLWYKFRLQPFSGKTPVLLLICGVSFAAAYFLFQGFTGLPALVLKCGSFTILLALLAYMTKVSPDIDQLLVVARSRFQRKKP